MILNDIVKHKIKEIELIKKQDFSNLQPANRNFKSCLKGKHNIIAEIKHSSPSEGKLRDIHDIKYIAQIYDQYANAISLVTDEKFFSGDIQEIEEIKQVSSLPVLRKDFIICREQILESRFYGADAILLIAAILTNEKIDEFITLAKQYQMDCLVEIHTEEELLRVLKTKAEIIGINNRNLNDFTIDINTTNKLKSLIPKDKIVVSESGITNLSEITYVNTNAVLIGTTLMKSPSLEDALSQLRTPKVKICGITNLEDAKKAINNGADFLGFNFYKESPRHISPDKAKQIIETLPNTIAAVGIFVNEREDVVKDIITKTGIDFLQFHGNEGSEYCEEFTLPVIKAFAVQDTKPDTSGYNVFAFLFDSFNLNMYGGTGEVYDYSLLDNFKRKIFLAGGLNKNNVLPAIKLLDPYCVDVCSSIESKPGIKDETKLKQFMVLLK
jgi:indole-3-glycerol phosphate synthase / phosphoribosylanthranilate isomerase